jgi:6,7-dimethyl-8-ribityllumazine synthase
MRLAFVAAEFNRPLVDHMALAARDEAAKLGGEVIAEVRVPGSYEIPLVLSHLLARGKVDAAVVLGYIERGETLHGEVMGQVVHRSIVDLELATRKPVGIGIIGPGATPAQAETRKDDYARAAVRAAAASLAALASLEKPKKKRR